MAEGFARAEEFRAGELPGTGRQVTCHGVSRVPCRCCYRRSNGPQDGASVTVGVGGLESPDNWIKAVQCRL